MAIAIHGPSGGGTDASGATAAAGQVLSPYTFIGAAGTLQTGSILSKSAQTYTPGTASQQIAAGQYLSGAQTIAGDANLVAANIVSGKSIFGVAGSAAAVQIRSNKDLYLMSEFDASGPTLTTYTDFRLGGVMSAYYSGTTLPTSNGQVAGFNLIVPYNDWASQWWEIIYYSSIEDGLTVVTSSFMSADKYKCSITYDSANYNYKITVPAMEGMTMEIDTNSGMVWAYSVYT